MSSQRLSSLTFLVLSGCNGDGATDTSTTMSTTSTTVVGTTEGPAPTTGDPGTTSMPTTASDPTTGDPAPSSTSSVSTTDATTGSPIDPQELECATPPCFNIFNNCPLPLWIKSTNGIDTLQPDGLQLAPGEWQQYAVPAEWSAGRVNAHWQDPNIAPEAHDKVEMTVTGGIMNYNITYVDYVALPAEMVAVGPDCPTTDEFDPKIGCYVTRDTILNGCPDGLLSGERCLSAGIYCSDPNHQAEDYCHALDAKIAECVAMHPETCGVAGLLGDSTPNAYSCSGYFDSQPPDCMPASPACHYQGNRWCAALNRGMLADPDSTDISKYYQTGPYNTYSKWVHDTCPGIYAFAYDDYPPNAGESGFRACKADRLDITFCPQG